MRLWLFVRDKAGGYGIQALGGMLVEYVHGDFLNVVGFPLNHFCKQLDAVFNSSALSSGEEILSLSETIVSTHTRSRRPEPTLAAATSPKSAGPARKVGSSTL